MRKFVDFGCRLGGSLMCVGALLSSLAFGQSVAPPVTPSPGQSRTLLPDGSWLVVGGLGPSGPQNTVAIVGTAGAAVPLPIGLARSRAWQTATVLPQGNVLILGGTDTAGIVETAEIFDPSTLQFQTLSIGAPVARAYHTATLLTNGQVLVAGGVSKNGALLQEVELWDSQTGIATTLTGKLSAGRRNHTATLLPDGKVLLWGGVNQAGATLQNGELYDPESQSLTPVNAPPGQSSNGAARLAASLPADGATGVTLGSSIALRFSTALNVATVNATTVTLSDSLTPTTMKVVAAEGGMLAFLTPQVPLLPSTTYTASVDGPTDASGGQVVPAKFSFTTAADQTSAANATAKSAAGNTNEPDNLPPLQAPPGVTSLAGRVLLSLNAQALPGVTLELQCGTTTKSAQTDATGRFLIASVPSGHCALEIDGTATSQRNKTYGTYFVGVDITASQTNVLPYFIWLTELDTAHAVTIPSPTTSEVVATNPLLKGLELHIPPNTVISDYNGKVITQVSITPIPLGRPPFPLPTSVSVAFYFTIQPGGAFLKVTGNGPQGARLIYPNVGRAPVGERFDFWNYDPDQKGWYVYGQGTVSSDRRSIVPDPAILLYRFTGAMEGGPGGPAPNGPGPCQQPGCKGADPVDLGTGLMTLNETDLYLPDVIPITLTRSYRQGDNLSRAFGVGTSHAYNAFISGPSYPQAYTYADLILPDGGRIHYPRISSGTGYTDAVFEHTGTQTKFYKSQITWNGTGWNLKFKDGTLWVIADGYQKSPTQGALVSITDRNLNTLNITRDGTGNITRITSPNGRWISFTYDAASRIIQAQDNSGRSVGYSYDSSGRLASVTDANNGITRYTYDAFNQMLTITDPRNTMYITNYYDDSGRVIEQDMADGGVFHLAYTLDQNGNIIQTDVTNPRGFVERSVFNTSSYFSGGSLTSFIRALGRPEQQTTTYQYDSNGLMLSSTDPLGRQTTFAYDASGCGNITGITRLAGTPNAVTTTMAYQTPAAGAACVSVFNQATSITDPLSHSTTFGYDSTGKNLTSVTDPLQHSVTIAPNSNGQPASIADFAGTTTFSYTGGDLTRITDPTGNATQRTLDPAGRLARLQAPLGQVTQYQYDALNELLQVIDPMNGQINFTYDRNGNLLTVLDANHTNTTTYAATYTPNSMDRVGSRKDALLNSETYQYDLNGNPSVFVDRKNQVTSNTYDGLDRLTQVLYQDQSTATYTYDAGNRMTQIVDSISGTITRAYDGLNRLTSETTPQGSVSYTYDNAARRSTMTVAGQSAVNYTYDNANRLTQIAQGTATVAIGYDNANRRTSLTLPNGVIVAYSYDAASRVTSIAYTQGQTTIGNLTYTYDANGRRTSMGGSLAHVNLPAAANCTSPCFNANNQLTNWNGATLSYDPNGNMTNDGATSYIWNARNRLAAFGSTGFAYDAFGRRTQNATGTAFLYDGVNPVQELSGSTVTANLLTGAVDEVFTRTDSAGARNFLGDALGSTVALTDSSGTVQTQYTYEPFGKTTLSGASSTSVYQYSGRENDGTGLYYYRGRYYHPTLQRFISEDPIGLLGGINRYAYVGNAPTRFIDPMGLNKDGVNWGPILKWGVAGLGLAAMVLGPEEWPLAAAGVEEATAGAEAAEVLGGAQNVANGVRLANQLAFQEAESAFTASGELAEGTISGSGEIIPAGQLGNPAIPQGFSKFASETFQSPSGPFQIHFYMNPTTGEVFYGLDYKVIFNSGIRIP